MEEGEELVMDEGAYVVYHQANLGAPCLSFDVIPDDQGSAAERASNFPATLYGVAGSQANKMANNNILVFKMHNLHPLKKQKENEVQKKKSEEKAKDIRRKALENLTPKRQADQGNFT